MDSTREPDDNTSLPPDVIAKSLNISQSKSKLTDSGSYQANNGPTPQGRPSQEFAAGNALLDEHLDNAAGAKPAADSGESLQREPQPTDNQTTTIPSWATSRGRRATRLDASFWERARLQIQASNSEVSLSFCRSTPASDTHQWGRPHSRTLLSYHPIVVLGACGQGVLGN
jgi:hypothetical protein